MSRGVRAGPSLWERNEYSAAAVIFKTSLQASALVSLNNGPLEAKKEQAQTLMYK